MSRPTRFALALAVSLLIGGARPGLEAQALPLPPELVGAWTSPFEEGGAGQPRCGTAADGRIICKPAAVSTAVLPDGRVLFANGLESTENAKEPVVPAIAQQSRNSAARLLDLRSGTPAFAVPTPALGARSGA